METNFKHLKQTRENILSLLDKHAGKEHMIPKGFSNSLYWNAAHCLVTQQLLCYKLSGEQMQVDEEIIELYRKGTAPTNEIPSLIEVGRVKQLLLDTVDKLALDYKSGLFRKYEEYPTSYGITLTSIEDAIAFNNIHEGLHFGYMLAMSK